MLHATDAESYEAVISVLRGERLALDAAAMKMLRFMLDDPRGCDAEITPASFTVRYGWNYGPHSYYLWCAPGVVSFLLDGTSLPATRQLTRQLGPVTIARSVEFPAWSFEARHVRIEALIARVVIRVREDATSFAELPEPPPRNPSPRFAALAHACPHCGRVPEHYRALDDGGLVCLACGRSSQPPR
jgi:hypothetical protein